MPGGPEPGRPEHLPGRRRQYGVPYNFGLVGFWYNKDLFAQAGITEPPATWEEFLADVQALKDAGITPIALAGGDKWPAMFYWAYLALRAGGQAASRRRSPPATGTGPPSSRRATSSSGSSTCEPFQDGFLAAAYNRDQAPTMGNGKAAMELMGQWAPGVQTAKSESATGIGEALGWFPFPAVDGGAGLPTDVFGGADGYAVGKDAPPEAVDFLCYLSSEAVAERFAATNTGILPPTEAAMDAVTDPTLRRCSQKRAEATFAQLYLDQATTPALGQAINDAIQRLFAGQASPEDVAQRDHRRRAEPVTASAIHLLDRAGGDAGPIAHRGGQRCRSRWRPAPARRRAAGRRWSTVALFVLPALVVYALFVLLPIVQAGFYSLFKWNGLKPLTDFVGLANYQQALTDPVFLGAISHNVLIIVLSLVRPDPVRARAGAALNRDFPGRAVLRLLFFAPYVIAEVIAGVVFQLMLTPDGLVDQGDGDGRARGPRPALAGGPRVVMYTLFVIISWKYFGFHMIIMLAGLQDIPREVEEAALVDGASRNQTIRHITLPLLGPTIRVSVFLSIIGALQLFDLVWATTKGGPVNASNTMAIYMFD